jgi:hypothetical protein
MSDAGHSDEDERWMGCAGMHPIMERIWQLAAAGQSDKGQALRTLGAGGAGGGGGLSLGLSSENLLNTPCVSAVCCRRSAHRSRLAKWRVCAAGNVDCDANNQLQSAVKVAGPSDKVTAEQRLDRLGSEAAHAAGKDALQLLGFGGRSLTTAAWMVPKTTRSANVTLLPTR